VVWALGRELRVRHKRRFASAGDRVADGAELLRARRRLAAAGAESRWSFGESLRSYEAVSTKAQGNSTPSQTAWD